MSGLHGDVKVEVSKKSDTIYHATYNPYMQGKQKNHLFNSPTPSEFF